MVVALLGALFLLGAAFLSSVSFESQAISSIQAQRAKSNVIQSLIKEIETEIRKAAVGGDGIPYNQDHLAVVGGASAIGNDTYGEIQGVHPLLASIEPYDVSGTGVGPWIFRYASDLELTVADTPLNQGINAGGTLYSASDLVFIDAGLGNVHPLGGPPFNLNPYNWINTSGSSETDEGDTNLDTTTPGPLEVYRRDADGDGVWDSVEHQLPLGRYPDSIRGDLPEQLSEDQANSGIYYAIRAISHGGMINLNHAHDELLKTILLTPAELTSVQGLLDAAGPNPPFAPESEEASLRRRFLLPPREIPLSTMQGRAGILPDTLYLPFLSSGNTTGFIDEPPTEDARWWPIDTGDNGADTNGNIAAQWLPWADPANPIYDFRHLTTTVSYDDNLMRIGRDTTGAPPFDEDWVEQMQAAERVLPGVNVFLVDQWPNTADPTDPVNGRQKISLPSLDGLYLDPADNGGLGGIDSVATHPFGLSFIGTLQDAFTMLLWNADLDTNGTVGGFMDFGDLPLRTAAAAALTANLIDYADSNDTPTPVQGASYDFTLNTGLPNASDLYYFGLERQPFITEMYASVVQTLGAGPEASSVYAIELHNPYDVPIFLDNYLLKDISTVAHAMTPHGVTLRFNSGRIGDFAPGTSILPGGFVVFHLAGYSSPGGGSIPIPGINRALDPDSIVQLRRILPDPTGQQLDIRVAVDQFDVVADTFGLAGAFGEDDPGLTSMVSLERDTRNWRFVVPFAGPQPAPSLGLPSVWTENLIVPVHLDFANSGDVRTAFPTTGSLLLLLRFANGYDTRNNVSLPPFNVPLRGNDIREPYSQVDNGRMPIFNQAQWSNPTPGPTSLNVPWGQLVFDYFTALPLQHTRTGVADMTPTVDQNGMRVHGRIDINAAPWWVLQGLPLMPDAAFAALPGNAGDAPAVYAASIEGKIVNYVGLGAVPGSVGPAIAQSMVAYREARAIGASGNFQTPTVLGGDRYRGNATTSYTGFLTVGELANVRTATIGAFPKPADIDGGMLSDGSLANDDFIEAAALLIALGDWVTTRSHVFTVYGTLRGAGTKSAVDTRAVRFQETVDRMPCFFDNKLPQRIGQLIVGDYDNARND